MITLEEAKLKQLLKQYEIQRIPSLDQSLKYGGHSEEYLLPIVASRVQQAKRIVEKRLLGNKMISLLEELKDWNNIRVVVDLSLASLDWDRGYNTYSRNGFAFNLHIYSEWAAENASMITYIGEDNLFHKLSENLYYARFNVVSAYQTLCSLRFPSCKKEEEEMKLIDF